MASTIKQISLALIRACVSYQWIAKNSTKKNLSKKNQKKDRKNRTKRHNDDEDHIAHLNLKDKYSDDTRPRDSWVKLTRKEQSLLLKASSYDNCLNKLNKKRLRNGNALIQFNETITLLENEEHRKIAQKSASRNNDFVAKESDFANDDFFSNATISKKELSIFKLKEGLLPDSIAKKKIKARQERKKKELRRHHKEDKKRSLGRKKTKHIEMSASAIDAYGKRVYSTPVVLNKRERVEEENKQIVSIDTEFEIIEELVEVKREEIAHIQDYYTSAVEEDASEEEELTSFSDLPPSAEDYYEYKNDIAVLKQNIKPVRTSPFKKETSSKIHPNRARRSRQRRKKKQVKSEDDERKKMLMRERRKKAFNRRRQRTKTEADDSDEDYLYKIIEISESHDDDQKVLEPSEEVIHINHFLSEVENVPVIICDEKSDSDYVEREVQSVFVKPEKFLPPIPVEEDLMEEIEEEKYDSPSIDIDEIIRRVKGGDSSSPFTMANIFDRFVPPEWRSALSSLLDLIKEVCGSVFSILSHRLTFGYFCFLRSLTRAVDMTDIFICFYQFFELLFPFVIVKGAALIDQFIGQNYHEIENMADEAAHRNRNKSFNAKKYRIHTEAVSDKLNAFENIFARVISSDFSQSFIQLIMSFVSCKWFPTDVSSVLMKFLGRPSKMTMGELFLKVLSAITTLFKYGEALARGVPFNEIIIAEDPISAALTNSADLLYFSDKTYLGLPVEGMKDRRLYRKELSEMIIIFDEILKAISPFDHRKKQLLARKKCLQAGRVEIDKSLRTLQRLCPLGVVLTGPPGVGKSKILNLIARVWSHVKGREHSEDQHYTRSRTSEYWEGYNSDAHPIIHYSEIGNMSTAQAEMQGDPMLVELNSLIDSLPYQCDMAFGDKGKIYADPELVLIDTNNENMHIDKLMYSGPAIKRRFLYISMSVKMQFRKQGTTMLDPTKSFAEGGNLLDRYNFIAYIYKVKSNTSSVKHDLFKGDVNGLILFMKVYNEKFLYEQERIQSANLYKFVDDILDDDEEKADMNMIVVSESKTATKIKKIANYSLDVFESAVDYSQNWFSYSRCIFLNFLYSCFAYLLLNGVKFSSSNAEILSYTPMRIILVILMAYFILSHTYLQVTLISCCCIIPLFSVQGILDCILQMSRDCFKEKIINRYESSTSKLRYMLLGGTFNPFQRGKWTALEKLVPALVFTAISAHGAKRYYDSKYKNRKEGITESSTFHEEDEMNTQLTDFESNFEVSGTKTRYKTRAHPNWAVKTNVVPPAVYTGDPANLYHTVISNVRKVRVSTAKTTIKTCILGIKGSVALLNMHALGGCLEGTITLSPHGDFNTPQHNKDIDFKEKDLYVLGNDMVLIDLEKISFRDILHHFSLGNLSSKMQGVFNNERVRVIHNTYPLNLTDEKIGDFTITTSLQYVTDHKPGMCGMPLVCAVDAKSSVIAGIHIGGDDDSKNAFAVVTNQDDIMRGFLALRDQVGLLQVYSQAEVVQNLSLPLSKSLFRYESVPRITYYGKMDGPVLINKRSRMIKGVFVDEIDSFFKEEFNFQPDIRHTKPIMKPIMRDGLYISPYNIGVRKMNTDAPKLDTLILQKIVHVYSTRIITMLKERGATKMKPISVQDAINGIERDDFISRINPTTSGGFGYKGLKSDHIPIVYETSVVIREPTPELKKRIIEIFGIYEKQTNVGFIYNTQLKDEPREVSKALAGKTRLFYMSPLDNLIVSRMFLAVFYSTMVEHSDIFCTAVGIDMHTQSDALVTKLKSFSSYIMEGDYSGFDLSNPLSISRAAATVVSVVLEHFGYNKDAMKITDGILSDGLFPMVNLNQDLFCKPGMQMSGKYGTAEDNSLRGVLMLMYAWYAKDETKEYDFFDYVLPIVYGDDLIAAVKPEFSEVYNNTTYQQSCHDFFKMTFTSASKSMELENFVSVDSMSFLKRTFVYFPNTEIYVGRLCMNSIYKTLEWTIPSSSVSIEDQTVSTVQSVLWELFFHCESENHYFKIRQRLISMLIIQFGGTRFEYERDLPTYQKIHTRVFDSGNVEDCETIIHDDFELRDTVRISAESFTIKESYLAYFDHFLPYRKNVQSQFDGVHVDTVYLNQRHTDIIKEDQGEIFTPEDMLEVYKNELEDLNNFIFVTYSASDSPSLYQIKHCSYFCTNERYRRELKEYSDVLSRKQNLEETIRYLERRISKHYAKIHTQSEVSGQDSGIIDSGTMNMHENVEDISGTITDYTDAGDAKYPSLGQEETLYLEDFFNRPVEIANFSLPIDSTFDGVYPIWDLYTLNPTVRAKLRNYAYLHGDLNVRIAISGSPFHYGRVMVSYQPYPERNININAHLSAIAANSLARPLFLNYLSQAPGATTMDVKNNQPLEIKCPFISTKPMFRLYNSDAAVMGGSQSFHDCEEAGSLFIYSLNPVKAVSVSPSEVSVQIYAWMTDVNLGCPTATQMTILTESEDERKTGPVERVSTAMSVVTDALGTIPYIAPLAKASSMVLKGISGISAWFGWSKPVMLTQPGYVKNRPFSNGAETIGCDTNKRIVVDPKQELTVDPRVVGVEHDELAIASLVGIESYLETFVWSTGDTLMSNPIWRCRVHPQLETFFTDGVENYYQPTAMSYAVTPFVYWRGTITFRFEIVVSAYHRGKIAIYYEPNIAQAAIIDLNLSTNKNFLKIIDIQETQSFEVCANWAHPRAWALTMNSGTTQYNTDAFSTSEFSYEYVNGYLGVVPFTDIQSPDDSDVSINVYVKSDDMMVNQFSQINLPTRRIVTESQNISQDLSDQPVTCINLNDSTASTEDISCYHFGEQPISFRGLLRRYVTTSVLQTGAGAVNNNLLRAYFQTFVRTTPSYGSVAGVRPLTLFDYLPYAFLGMRGGMKKRIHVRSENDAMGPTERISVSIADPLTFQFASIAWVDAVTYSESNGTVNFVPNTNGGVEFEIPFYSNNLFATSFTNNFIGSGNTVNDMITRWSQQYKVDMELATNDSTYNIVMEESAAGEDFTYLRFTGAPFYSAIPVA